MTETDSETEPEGVLGGKPAEFVSETEFDPETALPVETDDPSQA